MTRAIPVAAAAKPTATRRRTSVELDRRVGGLAVDGDGEQLECHERDGRRRETLEPGKIVVGERRDEHVADLRDGTGAHLLVELLEPVEHAGGADALER